MSRAGLTIFAVVLSSMAPTVADARGHSGGHYSGSHSFRSSGSGAHHASGYRGHSSAGSHHSGSHSYAHHSGGSHSTRHGKYKRDPLQKRAFMRQHPCPSTGRTSGACPGYVVDHVRPLKRGGADIPSNMQWQTKEAAKAKDKWE